jgi:putative glutamine amidotransferase
MHRDERTLIGITTYGRDEGNRFSLPAEYVDSVRRAGAVAVLLPPGEASIHHWLDIVDGIVLAGGGDVDPTRYGGPSHETIYMVDGERDRSELELTGRILDQEIPTLAICRGAQIVNVALGGSLYVHLPDAFGEQVRHRLPPREPTTHGVAVEAGSRLARILGATEFDSASWHHQAAREVAPSLVVVGHAPDGVVEAFESREHPWLFGVQWHPELTAAEDPIQQRLFDALVAAARDARSSGKG